ncbi:hypothetical protein C8J55DRAFT_113915 [Lentinula edodes]|uniref:Uncharacterized protein n=1 Tax=Lentinula lateritia TaxID=40482 RepID=A0A9W9E1T1_9AGAR|nr:hypothetical protein C8J55DRAFT_113915 [Lentinula edodes]
MVSDTDRLRIAITLTALKFKKPDQSCHSCVLELRSKFPPSVPHAPTTDGSWRTHALDLENEIKVLKERQEEEQIEYLARVNEATAALAAFQTSSTGIGVQGSPEEPNLVQNSTLLPNAEVSMKTAVPKKKGKQKKSNVLDSNGVNTTKKSSAQAPVPFKSEAQVPRKPLRLDLQAIFKEFQGCDSLEGRTLNSTPIPCTRKIEDSLFSSFSGFDRLVLAFATHPTPLTVSQKTLLLSSTIRTLDAISRVLNSVISLSSSPSGSLSTRKTNSMKTIQTLNILLTHLLSTSFEFLFPRTTSLPEDAVVQQPGEKKRQGKKILKKDKDTSHSRSDPAAGSSNPPLPLVEEFSPEFWTSLERLFGILTTSILEPTLKSFVSLSQHYLSTTFAPESQSIGKAGFSPFCKFSDIRPDLLSLFQSGYNQISQAIVLVDSVDSLLRSRAQGTRDSGYACYASGVREYLSLVAVRELSKLFAVKYSSGFHSIDPTHNIRSINPSLKSFSQDLSDPTISTCMKSRTSGILPLPQSSAQRVSASTTEKPLIPESSSANVQSRKKATAPKPVSQPPRARSREARIRELARKDAVWYLSTVLHVLFEDGCFSDDVNDIGGIDTDEVGATITSVPSFEMNASSTNPGLNPNGDKSPDVSVPSESNSLSTSSGSKELNHGIIPPVSVHLKVDNISQRHSSLNANEAARSSLSLLRTGLLDSFDALLFLVTECRPAASFPVSRGCNGSLAMPDVNVALSNASANNVEDSMPVDTSGQAGGGIVNLHPTVTPSSGSCTRQLAFNLGSGIMDEIEYDMVLGVVERYWECTLGLKGM